MRILWFSPSSGNYRFPDEHDNGNHGGGWVASLQTELTRHESATLGVCFCEHGEPAKVEQAGVTYYIVPHHKKSLKDKFLDLLRFRDMRRDEVVWPYYISYFRQIIEDFQPDVIEVFGSELYIGLGALAAKELNVPCVLHLQGLLSLSIYIYMPPSMSLWQWAWRQKSLRQAYAEFQTWIYWKRSCRREKTILASVEHVIGRTDWDKNALEMLNPHAAYHYGGEILRSQFYEAGARRMPKDIVISTTISRPTYKGFDLILKVADILKNELHLSFVWNVYGNVEPAFWERRTGIRHGDVNVSVCGVADAGQLRSALLGTTLYFHPSYVENSPNSVAEAQMMGLPVVATNVGGTSSMVAHGETGFLFPATDPYMGAYYVRTLTEDKEKNIEMGRRGSADAFARHDRDNIVNNLLAIYKSLIQNAQ